MQTKYAVYASDLRISTWINHCKIAICYGKKASNLLWLARYLYLLLSCLLGLIRTLCLGGGGNLTPIKTEANCFSVPLHLRPPPWLIVSSRNAVFSESHLLSSRALIICSPQWCRGGYVHQAVPCLEGPSRDARLPTFESSLDTESSKLLGTRLQQRLFCQGVDSVHTLSWCHFNNVLWFHAKQVGTLCLYLSWVLCPTPQRM